MKFAILSDIHGNIFALEECFKYIDKMNIDAIIWCGDYITDVPRSHEVIEFIKVAMKKYKSYIVRGNREDYIIDYNNSDKIHWTMENRMGGLLCTYNELNQDDIKFISGLPETCIIDIPDIPKIFVSHKLNYKDGRDCTYKIFGHSHRQFMFPKKFSKYINPGSIGLAIGSNIGAEFSVLELNKNYHKLENYSIKYDINKPIELIKNSMINNVTIKWGDGLIKTMQTGIDFGQLYLKEVQKIARECGLSEDLDEIPIEIWHKARKNLDI